MRRREDSNLWSTEVDAGFQDQCIQPDSATPPIYIFILKNCGEGGIRTHGTRKRTHAFQACSLSHSDTSPIRIIPPYFSQLLLRMVYFRHRQLFPPIQFLLQPHILFHSHHPDSHFLSVPHVASLQLMKDPLHYHCL